MQEAFKKVEKDAFRFAGENEKLKRNIEELQEEIDRLRRDAAVMKSILDHAAANAETSSATAGEESAPRTAAPRRSFGRVEAEKEPAISIPMGDQLSAFDMLPAEPAVALEEEENKAVAADASESDEMPVEKSEKPKTKSRVGTMFDLLTFSDV